MFTFLIWLIENIDAICNVIITLFALAGAIWVVLGGCMITLFIVEYLKGDKNGKQT